MQEAAQLVALGRGQHGHRRHHDETPSHACRAARRPARPTPGSPPPWPTRAPSRRNSSAPCPAHSDANSGSTEGHYHTTRIVITARSSGNDQNRWLGARTTNPPTRDTATTVASTSLAITRTAIPGLPPRRWQPRERQPAGGQPTGRRDVDPVVSPDGTTPPGIERSGPGIRSRVGKVGCRKLFRHAPHSVSPSLGRCHDGARGLGHRALRTRFGQGRPPVMSRAADGPDDWVAAQDHSLGRRATLPTTRTEGEFVLSLMPAVGDAACPPPRFSIAPTSRPDHHRRHDSGPDRPLRRAAGKHTADQIAPRPPGIPTDTRTPARGTAQIRRPNPGRRRRNRHPRRMAGRGRPTRSTCSTWSRRTWQRQPACPA